MRSILCLLTLAAVLAGCGAGSRAPRPSATTSPAVVGPASTPSLPPRPPRHRVRRRPHPSPGRLPQTDARPSGTTAEFHRQMAALWRGILRDSVRSALPAFFPESAYEQIKAIADAQADWRERLVGAYAADLKAAHALVGRDVSGTRLLRVIVPPDYAHWVPPGVCYNRVGYWETPNSRIVYRQGGQVRSFGIASMISWRGRWYVVHLGAVVRSGLAGIVDDPSPGPGYPAPSSTC